MTEDLPFNDDEDDPEVYLRKSALAAGKKMKALEDRLLALQDESNDIRAQIERWNKIQQLAWMEGGPPPTVQEQPKDDYVKDEKEPQIVSDLDVTLYGSRSSGLKVSEIRALIKLRFERSYGDSTLYSYLSKGKGAGKYLNENSRWTLSKEAIDKMETL